LGTMNFNNKRLTPGVFTRPESEPRFYFKIMWLRSFTSDTTDVGFTPIYPPQMLRLSMHNSSHKVEFPQMYADLHIITAIRLDHIWKVFVLFQKFNFIEKNAFTTPPTLNMGIPQNFACLLFIIMEIHISLRLFD
jgi:hypothetical protein